jgi:hypothetical protein
MRVVADEVASDRHLTGQIRVGGDPAALEEEGSSDCRLVKYVQNSLEVTGTPAAAVRVLGVNSERH